MIHALGRMEVKLTCAGEGVDASNEHGGGDKGEESLGGEHLCWVVYSGRE